MKSVAARAKCRLGALVLALDGPSLEHYERRLGGKEPFAAVDDVAFAAQLSRWALRMRA